MKRSSFLESLIGIGGLMTILPEAVKQYEKVFIKQCFVRGFQYYDGPKIIDNINKSGLTELVREPNNKYDKRAIAVYFDGNKLGYIPKESNKTISILMDTELLEFHAEISHIEPNASDWEKIFVVVYALKEIKNASDMKKIEPFSFLITPNYYSLRSADNTVTRINIPDGEDEPEISSFQPKDTGVFLFETIENERLKTKLAVMYYSYDTIDELERELETDGLIKYSSSLPQAVDQEVLSDNLISAYSFSQHKGKNGIFAINVNKLFDEDYCISGLKLVKGKNEVDFFEVEFEWREKQSRFQSPEDWKVIIVEGEC